jgi:hypothetical protein
VKSMMAGIGGALLATLAVATFQTRASDVPLEAKAAVTAAEAAAGGLPVAIRCEPGQRAVVRQVVASGELVTAADCAGEPGVSPGSLASARVAPASLDLVEMPRARVSPAVHREPAPRVVSARTAEPKRSWRNTALIIGGSAGAGAGIGGLTGGKKGALIGAAIGGGAASIYEAVKR